LVIFVGAKLINTFLMNTEKVANHIVNWLKNYAVNAKVNGFVVGVSGGIDSAITSALCARTGLPTLCLEMPIHQGEAQLRRANEHIAGLKKNYRNVQSELADLSFVFDTFVDAMPSAEHNAVVTLSLANTRSRLRMTALYYFAGINGYLVVGTGNKVEDFGVGFFTKYGDGGVDLSPIADLMKSEVYKLGAFLKVPESILNAPPTDGLFGDDRTDEDQLGASYDELEWAMKMAEKGNTADQFTGREKEVFEIFTSRNKANKHKMVPIPVCEIPDELK
jgi:NAD+ synthase